MSVDIDIKDYSKIVLEDFKRNRKKALSAIGAKAQDYASKDAPLDTGRLQSSIDFRVVGDKEVQIGTNVEYAVHVEYIDRYHHNSGKAHFLRDAASTHWDEYIELIIAAMNS